jgi:hypothetical protein
MWTNIATISYSTAALAFFFLFVLLITSWRGRLYGMILSVACLLSAAWAFTTAINISWNLSFTAIANLLEILRSAGWSAFLIALIGPFQQKRNFTLIPNRDRLSGTDLLHAFCLSQRLVISGFTTDYTDRYCR